VADSALRRIYGGEDGEEGVADTPVSLPGPSVAGHHAIGLPWAAGYFFPRLLLPGDDEEELAVRCALLGVEVAGRCGYLRVDRDKMTFVGG
jgi:hypothetical protein